MYIHANLVIDIGAQYNKTVSAYNSRITKEMKFFSDPNPQ